jgi:hypothetical protein
MKPLFLTITGINHTCEEFRFYESMISHTFDIACATLYSNILQSPTDFQTFLDTFDSYDLTKREVVIMAHSFGCIVALYVVQKYQIHNTTQLIFVDPTTQYMRQHAIKIGPYLGELLDSAPHNIYSPTTVFTYWPQGCTPRTCIPKHIEQHSARVDAIQKLWDDPTHPIIVSLYLPSTKLSYIPHNLHRLLPNNIGTRIHPILVPMVAGSYTNRNRTFARKRKTHLKLRRNTMRNKKTNT